MSFLTVFIGLGIAFASCGDEEEGLYIDIGAAPSDLSDIQIKKLIAENVNVEASYKDYFWHFEVVSTLHKALPNKSIEFGIGQGDVDGEIIISVEEQSDFFVSKKVSNGKEIINFENPFWFYYAFSISTPDLDTFTLCRMYYGTYKSLRSKGSYNWNSEEWELYKDITDYYDEKEKIAISYYTPSVIVLIDGLWYYVAKFKR